MGGRFTGIQGDAGRRHTGGQGDVWIMPVCNVVTGIAHENLL